MDEVLRAQVTLWAFKQLPHLCRDREADINRLAIIASKRFKHPHWHRDTDHWVYEVLMEVAGRLGYSLSCTEDVDCEDYTPKEVNPAYWQTKCETDLEVTEEEDLE